MHAQTLSMPISILNPKQPCCVEIGTRVSRAVELMQDGKFGCLLVVDSRRQLVGIVTERDVLMHIFGRRVDAENTIVDDVMTPNPEALCSSDPIAFALNHMHLGRYRHVPLVTVDREEGDYCPVGIVSTKDIMNYVATFLASEEEE